MSEEQRQFSPGPNTPPLDHALIAFLAAHSMRNDSTGCLEWTGYRLRGYGMPTYRGKTRLAHRLSYQAHFGPIPKGLHVCHTCDNPPCFAIEHLFLGTQQQNIDDMRRKGRARWATPVLNAPLVAEMKRRFTLGESPAHVARTFGKSYGAVFSVKLGHTWKHVPPATEQSVFPDPGASKRPIRKPGRAKRNTPRATPETSQI